MPSFRISVIPVREMVFYRDTQQIREHLEYDAFMPLATGGVLSVRNKDRLTAISELLLIIQREHDKARELATI